MVRRNFSRKIERVTQLLHQRNGERRFDITSGMRYCDAMAKFIYRAVPQECLQTYRDHGMEVTFDEKLFNGELIIDAPDEETADKIRMTYTDIRMWEKVDGQ